MISELIPMQALTPWFDSEAIPVRDGWYDVRTGAGKEVRAFYVASGKRGAWWTEPPGAATGRQAVTDVLERRGLVAPADEQAA